MRQNSKRRYVKAPQCGAAGLAGKRRASGQTSAGFWTFLHGGVLQCAIPCLLLLGLCSCIGVSADISVRANGSGKIFLEYRVSQMAESLGRLDGNERWQTVPLGRPDFERTLDRIPGMRLTSFSTKNQGNDIINRVGMEFKTIDALLAFLDYSGTCASFKQENGGNRLFLELVSGGAANVDGDLLALLREVSGGYQVRISFTAPGGALLALATGAENKPYNGTAARLVPQGKKVSLSIETGELLSLPEGLGVEITW